MNPYVILYTEACSTRININMRTGTVKLLKKLHNIDLGNDFEYDKKHDQ
jgi:hypothetical protein